MEKISKKNRQNYLSHYSWLYYSISIGWNVDDVSNWNQTWLWTCFLRCNISTFPHPQQVIETWNCHIGSEWFDAKKTRPKLGGGRRYFSKLQRGKFLANESPIIYLSSISCRKRLERNEIHNCHDVVIPDKISFPFCSDFGLNGLDVIWQDWT